jgi:3-deoxy-manno-octulosonate cytidylyltransferase (CMP-KDO synthetase)
MPEPVAIAVIPARFGSTRFPGKPLANRTGKPLIQHVVERVMQARRIGRVVVATDDQRIFDAVTAFDAEAVMTGEHPNGTSRIAEALHHLDPTGQRYPDSAIVVNVQGDEPEIDAAVIDGLVDALAGDADAPMATVASPLSDPDEAADPNIVKVVVDRRSRAMYFSRSPIPYHRDVEPPTAGPDHLKHLGVYAYRRAFLQTYVSLPSTPLELAEKLEQLRALEHGHPIAVIRAHTTHVGIDTPEQYEAFVRRHI